MVDELSPVPPGAPPAVSAALDASATADSPETRTLKISGARVPYRLIDTEVLGESLGDVLKEVPDSYAVYGAMVLTERLAMEAGIRSALHTRELYRAAQQALVNPRHYLHLVDRRLAASTLIALERLCADAHGKTIGKSRDGLMEKMDGSDAGWQRFLVSFSSGRLSAPDRLVIGAWSMTAKAQQYVSLGAELIVGGVTHLINAGDSAGIRLHNLSARSVAMIEKEIGPPLPEEVNPDRDAVGRVKKALDDNPSDAAFVSHVYSAGGRQTYFDLVRIFRRLSRVASRVIARQAAEALVALHTNVFQRRATFPIGQMSPTVPKFDGTDRGKVFEFLRTLGISPTQAQEEKVWNCWSDTWNQKDIKVGDLAWDLDWTLWNFELGFFSGTLMRGRDHIQIDPIIIRLLALAYRDKAPNIIMSNAIRARIADVANDPRFAAFRFAFFLRMPSDPYVTVEEVASMPTITTYEEMTEMRAENLKRVRENMGELAAQVQRLLADAKGLDERRPEGGDAGELQKALLEQVQALLSVVATLNEPLLSKGTWEATKWRDVLARYGKKLPIILIDDKMRYIEAFVRSGGYGGVLVPTFKRNRKKTLYNPQRLLFDPFVAAQHLMRTAKKPGVIVEVKEDDSVGIATDFPGMEGVIHHPQWGYKVWEGWVAPARRMILNRLGLTFELLGKGEIKRALRMLESIIKTDIRVLAAGQLRAEQTAPTAAPTPSPRTADEEVDLEARPSGVVMAALAPQAREEGEPTAPAGPAVAPPARTEAEPGAGEAPGPAGEPEPPKAALAFTIGDAAPVRIGDQVERPRFDGTAALAVAPLVSLRATSRSEAIRLAPSGDPMGLSRSFGARNDSSRLRNALKGQALLLDLQKVPGALAKLPEALLAKLVTSRESLAVLMAKRGFANIAQALRSSQVEISKVELALMTVAVVSGSRDDLEIMAAKKGLLQTGNGTGTALNPAHLSATSVSAGRPVLLVK